MKIEEIIKEKGIQCFPFSKIIISEFNSEKKKLSEKTRKQVEELWVKRVKETRHRGVELFDGPLVSIDKIEIKDDVCFISLVSATYSQYVGTTEKRSETIKELNHDTVTPLSFGCICITSDGFLAEAKRETTDLNKNRQSFPPEGYFIPEDFLNANFLYNACTRELHEEISREINILSLELMGGVYDPVTKNLYLAVIIYIDKNKEDIKFKGGELSGLSFIKNSIGTLENILFKKFTNHNLGKIFLFMQ